MPRFRHDVRHTAVLVLLMLVAGRWLPAAEVTKAQWRDVSAWRMASGSVSS